VVVEATGGPCPRVVPVLAAYAERLLVAARFAGSEFITGGVAVGRRNVTNPVVGSVVGGRDVVRLELGRLRASWLATQAGALGLAGLFAAAGIRCSQHLGDVVTRLAPPAEAELMRLLGATR